MIGEDFKAPIKGLLESVAISGDTHHYFLPRHALALPIMKSPIGIQLWKVTFVFGAFK